MGRCAILVVCTGNICRSPTGEGVLRAKARERGLEEQLVVASAGTHDYHVGEAPDPRTMKHATQRGYDLSKQRARQVSKRDFHEFDYILAMDRSHLAQLQALAPEGARARVTMFLEKSESWRDQDVPDPYYGGPPGFEHVLDMVEEAAEGWLDEVAGFQAPQAPRP